MPRSNSSEVERLINRLGKKALTDLLKAGTVKRTYKRRKKSTKQEAK